METIIRLNAQHAQLRDWECYDKSILVMLFSVPEASFEYFNNDRNKFKVACYESAVIANLRDSLSLDPFGVLPEETVYTWKVVIESKNPSEFGLFVPLAGHGLKAGGGPDILISIEALHE